MFRTLTSKKHISNLPPQKSLTAMPSLAPSDTFIMGFIESFSRNGCTAGSIMTSLQTSDRKEAVKLLVLPVTRSLLLIIIVVATKLSNDVLI